MDLQKIQSPCLRERAALQDYLCCQVELAGCVLTKYNAAMKMQDFPQIFFFWLMVTLFGPAASVAGAAGGDLFRRHPQLVLRKSCKEYLKFFFCCCLIETP